MEKIHKTILIVEDETSMLETLADRFVIEGFDVIQAKNGEEGLKSALGNQPDIILLDIVMPKMDGITMMKKLRESGEWGKNAPIILLTNLSATDKIMRSIMEGEPSYYLVKTDWTLDDVVHKIKERLGLGQ